MNKLLVILGPTATGKTDLALNLAKKFNGELVACDSRQVYRWLDIGTGKLPGGDLRFKNYDLRIKKHKRYWEIDGVRIWMYDVVDPKKQYTVADYAKDASKVISNIVISNKLSIIVGGAGLYLKVLLEGLPNLAIPVDPKLRKKLQKLSLKKLQKKIKEISFNRWNSLNKSDRENPRRLIRAIELVLTKAKIKRLTINDLRITNSNILKIGLTAPREVLYKRVDDRVVSRIKHGMIEEAKRLHKNGLTLKRMKQLGLEYGVLADYLKGKIKSIEELIKIMQNKIHGYVRRQLTWFKKEKDVHWFNITDKRYTSRVEKTVSKWYHPS